MFHLKLKEIFNNSIYWQSNFQLYLKPTASFNMEFHQVLFALSKYHWFTGNIPRGVFCEQSSQKTRELRRGDLFHIPFFRITTSFKFPAVLHFYSRFLLPDLTHQSPLYG